MNSVRAIQTLNKRELEAAITPEGSWHADYRDTAFIYIGGLPFELSEGDIITIFSQYGEPVWIKLARDKDTGKSRGFAWLKFEDQRSCDLAVDNLGGANIMDRILRVDHTRYKPRDDEDMRDNTLGAQHVGVDDASGNNGAHGEENASQSDSDEDRLLLPEEIELQKALENLDEEDPMKETLIKRLQEKADAAVQKYKQSRRKEKKRARKGNRRQRHLRSIDRSGSRDRDNERRKIQGGSHHRDEHESRKRYRRDRSHEGRRYSSDEDRYGRSPRSSQHREHRREEKHRHRD